MSDAANAPAAFLQKMQRLLGNEYAAFAASFAEPVQVGLRVNTLKLTAADFSKISPFRLTPVGAYAPAGFLVSDNGRPGGHPYHAAGLCYLQEPAAMAVAGLLAPQPGEWVLDLAAAPGGKATHLAALMQDTGLLVANDVSRSRARILAENLERWGTRHTLITNDTPQRLAEQFGSAFDRVLLDAPCSGEGLFRRQGPFEWSDDMVAACARRQSGILDDAARLVRPGGLLAYATCTFAPEENERVIGQFLTENLAFELLDPPRFTGFAPGRPDWVRDESMPEDVRTQLARAVRLWPQRFAGEGHFIALLRRRDAATRPKRLFGFDRFRASREAVRVWGEFVTAFLAAGLAEEQMVEVNGRLYLLPLDAPDTGSLRLVRYGLLLGEARKGHFRPAHTLALALRPSDVVLHVDWPADGAEIAAYLAGRDLPAPGPDGWTLVTMDGFALGWGKRVNGRLKNHYPRGLRLPPG